MKVNKPVCSAEKGVLHEKIYCDYSGDSDFFHYRL